MEIKNAGKFLGRPKVFRKHYKYTIKPSKYLYIYQVCRKVACVLNGAGSRRAQNNIFLPGSKPSTFISFYTLSSSFPIYHPILSLYLSLSFIFLPSFLSLLPPSFCLFSFFPSSFLGNLSISATFLVAPLPRYFVFSSPGVT